MELPDIDWRRVVSRFVRDEAYENIDAPKWADLAAPDPSPAVDDTAWFCRPDCRHPKTAEDFLKPKAPSLQGKLMRSSSEKLPLGERNADPIRDANNLKRRGAIGEGLRSKAGAAAGASRNFREDLENQNPNTPTPPRAARPFGGVPKGARNAKAAIKSSAEKKKKKEDAAAAEEEEEGGEKREAPPKKKKQQQQQPQLKSTLSARNLFSGKDILSQISEFCSEIKKLAVGVTRRSAAAAEGEEETVKQERLDLSESIRKDDDGSGKKSKKMVLTVETAMEKGQTRLDEKSPPALREVRASPPTPQRFPSPSSYRLRHAKAAAATSSPLKRPPRAATQESGGILEEMDQSTTKKKAVATTKDEECSSRASAASDSGGSGDMLWFFKPCSYLVK